MLLNLLNLYSLIFALFSKIEGMSKELISLQPTLNLNATIFSENTLNMSETLIGTLPITCFEIAVPCLPCHMLTVPIDFTSTNSSVNGKRKKIPFATGNTPTFLNILPFTKKDDRKHNKPRSVSFSMKARRGKKDVGKENEANVEIAKELEKLRNISRFSGVLESNESLEVDDSDSDENYDLYSARKNDITSEAYTNTESNFYTSNSTAFSFDYSDSSAVYEGFINDNISTQSNNINWTDITIPDYVYEIDTSATTKSETNTASSSNEYTTVYTEETTYVSEVNTESSSFSYFPLTDESNYITNKLYDIKVENEIKSSPEISQQDITTEMSSYYISSEDMFTSTTNLPSTFEYVYVCPNISFNCSVSCGDKNVTQIFFMSNCTVVNVKCYITKCNTLQMSTGAYNHNKTNVTVYDTVFFDKYHRKMYNLTMGTRKKLLKLCWETMFGQELVKLTMMDLVSKIVNP